MISSSSQSDIPMGNQQAVKAAQNYIDLMGFSYSGLVDQLKFEGYTDSEAAYGASNCGADWNAAAVKSAQSYLSLMSMSRDELYSQLEFDGYTPEQINYALSAVGY